MFQLLIAIKILWRINHASTFKINRHKKPQSIFKSKSSRFRHRGFSELESYLEQTSESEQLSNNQSFGYDFAKIAIHRSQAESAMDNLVGGKSYKWVVLQPPNFALAEVFLAIAIIKSFLVMR
ncbi:MAG: hypothetical protein HC836_16225 [Richelia sp. RM2_1_2]|nr:hypothetical protein [Richelia sp. RM2_1_2]